MLNRTLRPLVVSLLAVASLLFRFDANASGVYNHSHKAEVAIGMVQDDELRDILSDWDQLFKFAALFPDAFSGVDGTVHTAEFHTAYARAIRTECFDEPIGWFCNHRQDISCEPFGNDCEVRGSRVCTDDLSSCRLDSFPSDCSDFGNRCVQRGVCTDDYRKLCANTGSDCKGLGNTCSTTYGLCLKNSISRKCEKLITHFMGSVAHVVTDFNADKFFMRSVAEREDCTPWKIYSKTLSEDAQFYTDQEMDAHLGSDKGASLWEKLPDSRLWARTPVEDNFVDEVLLQTRDPDGKTGLEPPKFDDDGEVENKPYEANLLVPQLTGILDQQWFILGKKVNSSGERFDFFRCSKQPSNAQCDDVDLTNCKVCIPGLGNCKIEEDEDTGFDGVCTGTLINPDYVTPCKTDEGCPGITDRCTTRYGVCELLPAFRDPDEGACQWAIDDDRWKHQGGGTLDDAREIAKLIDESWRLMRAGKRLTFRRTGTFADGHLCVGEPGSDCLEAKTLEIIGGKPPVDPEYLDGQLSDWSAWRHVESIAVAQRTGWLRFALHGAPLMPEGIPAQVDCGAEKPLDLNLDEEPTETVRLADTLLAGFIEQKRVKVRTELTHCSAGGQFLVKNICIDGQAPIADAGRDQTLECTEPAGALVSLDGRGSCVSSGDTLTFAWSAPGIVFDDPTSPTPSAIFPIGTTTVTLEVSDGGETDTDEVDIEVVDTIAPTLSVSLDPSMLWPPNHQMHDITAQVEVSDACDPAPSFQLTDVTNSEPGNGRGDGNTAGDIAGHELGTDDTRFQLRAERSGRGPGRTYTATYAATDASGNSSVESTDVRVSHDQSPQPTTPEPIVENCLSTGTCSAPAMDDASFVLDVSVGLELCAACICDVDNDGRVTAGDALRVLKQDVGLPAPESCDPLGTAQLDEQED